jgi:dTDP-4-amino-4,6-dideoxygalactose transaminase
MSKLRLKGGKAVRTEPVLPLTQELAPAGLELLRAALSGPWALGQPGCPPKGILKRQFETRFADLVGVQHAIAVSSGTAALDLAVEALSLPTGGVIVAANYGHPSTVRQASLTHQLALLDVDPRTLCLAAGEVEEWLRTNTVRCVITTHFAGQAGGVSELVELCQRHGVPLIEDASHAHGARAFDRSAGNFGALGCFSIHASKNLPAAEGGVITTNSDALYGRLWRAHDLGRDVGAGAYDFSTLGGNYRLSEIHAALALAALPDIVRRAERRMARVERFAHQLGESGALKVLPLESGTEVHAYHLVVARYHPEACAGLSRRRFLLALSAEGIPCSAGWPALLSAHPGLVSRAVRHETPVAKEAVESTVWLPGRVFDDDGTAAQALEAVNKVCAEADTIGGQS